MPRSALVCVACVISIATLPLEASEAQQSSAREVVEQFCSLDANRKQPSPDGSRALAPLFADAGTREPNSQITVTKDVSFRDLNVGKNASALAVEYRVFGRVDSSLRSTPLQPAHSDQFVAEAERISLVLSETYYDLGTDGQWQQVKGTPEWRIKTAPKTPHPNIGAAIAYERAAGYKSKDPIIRANAQKAVREIPSPNQRTASIVSGRLWVGGPKEGALGN